MTVQLVHEPSVHVVAHTVISPTGLEAWADAHGHRALLYNDTPIGILHDDISHSPRESIDALPEFGGRFCYRSWEQGRARPDYLRNIVEMQHGSVLHHSTISFAISGVSRSLSLELLRHHAGADPSQESQRYVDAKDVRFVVPPLVAAIAGADDAESVLLEFQGECARALQAYATLQARLTCLTHPSTPGGEIGRKLNTMRKKRILEAARAHLPNSAETRLLWTMNLRAARHVCALRGGEGADLEIRRLAVTFTRALKELAPLTFYDFEVYEAADGFEATRCLHPKV
ncbi:FAD-dependent thymidylate synthase [Methylobacterium sp. CCH5-D2]|uniref:FAD-dependent thymidylate synthase n=1 Tax=Methylobacterium sp. CCH5-D2 TaxID=1768765 RepID=UPI0008320C92|nr:FAD-dependent thymidylate synthase [Methylobacterium sp. CCH5-D2]